MWFAIPSAAAWTIVDLGGHPSCADYSSWAGLNDTGQVVGCGSAPDGGVGALIWSPGAGAQVLGRFSASGYSVGAGINNSGQVAGSSSSLPFLWSGQTMINLCNTSDCIGGTASGISNSGQVVGTFFDANSMFALSVWHGDATPCHTARGSFTAAQAISSSGAIAGYGDSVGADGSYGAFAVLWSGSSVQNLGQLPNGFGSVAYGINNVGQVVGSAPNLDGGGAFLWSSETGMRNLGSLYQGGTSEAYAVNDFGQVVGASDGEPVLWSNGALVDLGALPEVAAAGWQLTKATAINNASQIAGTGLFGGKWGRSCSRQRVRCIVSEERRPLPARGQGSETTRPTNRCDPANSINPYTGNNYLVETDYVGASSFPLRFSATTAARRVLAWKHRNQWRHTYDHRCWVNPRYRVRPTQHVFTLVSADWIGDPDVMDRWVQTPASWTCVTAPDDDETYTSMDAHTRL
jgi:probable HAF family extracellular repeat protein